MNAHLIQEKSDPLMVNAAIAGLTIVDCLALGISPIALWCDERHVPLFERACPRFGYVYEWVPEWPDVELLPGQVRTGEAVLTKVGSAIYVERAVLTSPRVDEPKNDLSCGAYRIPIAGHPDMGDGYVAIEPSPYGDPYTVKLTLPNGQWVILPRDMLSAAVNERSAA